jgi:four helix bundle protein
MPKIEHFTDIVAWQKARILTKDIDALPCQGAFARDFGLAGQMQQASVSIVSNIAEGCARSGLAEFQQFLSIAKASSAEVESLLYVAFDAGYINQATFDRKVAQKEEVARLVGTFRSAIERERRQKA